MAKIDVEFKNMDKLVRLLTKGGAGARQALRQSLYREGALAFADSQAEVPVDTSMLRSSGQAYGIKVTESPNEIVITLGYGGVAAPYALIVHEDLNARHNSPTKAKYLEDPVKRRVNGMSSRIVDSIDKALRSI
jgi:hypothetical protein